MARGLGDLPRRALPGALGAGAAAAQAELVPAAATLPVPWRKMPRAEPGVGHALGGWRRVLHGDVAGRVAEIFYTALRDAAKRGLDVVLLVDYIGAFAIRQARRDWVRELRSAGCDVVFFNPVLPASGGMNIQEEVGEEIFGTSRFYDVHAKLQGPCVADLAEVFRDSLKEAGRLAHASVRADPAVQRATAAPAPAKSHGQKHRRSARVGATHNGDSTGALMLLPIGWWVTVLV
eukprot:Skav230925  [mRNA]  locus=scaffold3487:85565:94954:+ [translate_table: standard]